ncbi:hypothetical protein MKEN_01135300 [Mycena kentingensis (nom. inval.)]|nr:hypothetical protein MKEN_01135300 [Mycena kentingensis (nom. inval.)]
MSCPRIFGLGYYREHRFVSLSLHVEAAIMEIALQHKLKINQTYGDDTALPVEAIYAFPVPAGAEVSNFVMLKQDGTRVSGVVQERDAPRETYNTAAGRQPRLDASLAEHETPDVFQVSVGTIPSKEKVEIQLSYTSDFDEESEPNRLRIPAHIGSCYGDCPQLPASDTWIASSLEPFLSLEVTVQPPTPLTKIYCSHSVEVKVGIDPKDTDEPLPNYALVSLTSDSVLDKDLVLTVKSGMTDLRRQQVGLELLRNAEAAGSLVFDSPQACNNAGSSLDAIRDAGSENNEEFSPARLHSGIPDILPRIWGFIFARPRSQELTNVETDSGQLLDDKVKEFADKKIGTSESSKLVATILKFVA